MDAGDAVTMRFVPVERVYRRRERVTLAPAEFVEIATTFVLYAQGLAATMRAKQERRLASQGAA